MNHQSQPPHHQPQAEDQSALPAARRPINPHPRRRVLLIAALILVCLTAFVGLLSMRYWVEPVTPIALPPAAGEPRDAPTSTPPPPSPPQQQAIETPLNSPATAQPTHSGNTIDSSPTPSPPAVNSTRLLIPVAGVRPEELRDTYSEARSDGRTHDAIDIIAPRGTPVLAAADGRIVKLFTSVPGGITIYQLSVDEKMVYYYAHLDRYADHLTEGHIARRGEVIGYVGDTGNATPGNYHLHFSVSLTSDPKRHWEGTNINPYPLLTSP